MLNAINCINIICSRRSVWPEVVYVQFETINQNSLAQSGFYNEMKYRFPVKKTDDFRSDAVKKF